MYHWSNQPLPRSEGFSPTAPSTKARKRTGFSNHALGLQPPSQERKAGTQGCACDPNH